MNRGSLRGTPPIPRAAPAGPLRPWAAVLVALALVGSACGSGDSRSKVVADKTTSSTAEASSSTTTSTGASTTTATAESTTTTAKPGTATTKPPRATTTTTVAPTTTTLKKLSGDITVLAAASLTGAFIEIGQAFEKANPASHVKFSFDSSSTLATQANNGAPADVFASADDANMRKATDGGSAQGPKPFTRNRLAIIVGKGNPKGIRSVKDFERSDVTWVRCADGVPCGDYAKRILENYKVDEGDHKPKSLELNVKGVVQRVTKGEVDGGIVYVTDGKAAASSSEAIDIPDDFNVIANYPVARLEQSGHADVADAFIAFVLSEAGQAILARFGFLPL